MLWQVKYFKKHPNVSLDVEGQNESHSECRFLPSRLPIAGRKVCYKLRGRRLCRRRSDTARGIYAAVT